MTQENFPNLILIEKFITKIHYDLLQKVYHSNVIPNKLYFSNEFSTFQEIRCIPFKGCNTIC